MPPKRKTQKKQEPAQEDFDEETSKANNKKLKTTSSNNTTSESGEGHFQHALGDGKFGKDVVKITSWNLNGIRASMKKDDFLNYLKNESPDVICINETKIDGNNFKKEKCHEKIPSEYSQYWNFCLPPNSGYAGSAIFSKVAPISVKYDLGISKHDQEGRTVTAEFEKFFLVACYVPNAGADLKRLDYRTKEWDIDFQKYLNDLKAKKATILCGDLNVAHQEIDLKNPGTNSKTAGFTAEERQGFTNFLNQGWIDTFRKLYPKEKKYSFWTYKFNARKNNTGWRLDYFVINEKSFKGVKDHQIRNDIYGSDHCPLELTLELKKL